MKRLFGILFVATVLVACNDDENVNAALDIDSADLEATSEAVFDDIDNNTDAALDFDILGSGRGFGRGLFGFDCAEVTKDEGAGTIVIDFGDGCEGRNGRVKKGKILISYSGSRFEPGSFKSVTFENFFIDSLQIEGTKTTTNVSASSDSNPTYLSTLVGGKMTFADGSFMTRETEHTKTKVVDFSDTTLIESQRYGTASGVNLEGAAYSHVIDESAPVTVKKACSEERVFAPVSGIITINVEGESEKVVDFGDGTCDNLVTITQDGVSETKEVNPKRKRRKQRRG